MFCIVLNIDEVAFLREKKVNFSLMEQRKNMDLWIHLYVITFKLVTRIN